MATFPILLETVFPTFNNVAPSGQDGKRWSEPNVTAWVSSFLGGVDFIKSGMLVPASSVSLSITIPLGEAYLKGYRVITTATAVTAAPSTTTYVFLKVNRDISGFVTDATFETNASPAPQTDATLICALIAGVGTITSTNDLASRNTQVTGVNDALIFGGL